METHGGDADRCLPPLENSSSVTHMRPTTLVSPEKEPVNFSVNLVGAPPEVEQLVEHIKIVAEQFLYHWKTFPIALPVPLACNTANNRKSRPINLRDLFVAPPFDELDAVAADGNGEPRRLTNNQLKSLRERGEFDVGSLNFPGQIHKWRLSQFLQKGTFRAHDSFLSDLALAARFFVVTARARIFAHFFSVAHALKALVIGLAKLIDMIVGVPSLLAHNLDYKIKEERCRYLVAELVCRPEYEDCLDSLCSYVRKQLRRATMEKFDVECESAQPVPYLFLTPKGQEIDLRLFSRDIIRKALPILIGILERETRGWFLHFRERLITELREKKLTDKEIEQEVNEAVMREYLQRVYSSILSNSDLEDLGDGIPQLLVQQAQSVVIMHKAVEKIQRELKRSREDHQKCLSNDHSVLSRVAPWLRSKLRTAEASKMNTSTWAAHEEAIQMCVRHNLQQTSYFLSRDLSFMKEREPVLLKELCNAKTPTRSFQWACRIWSPKSWIIRRNFQGQSEIIQTVICQQATSIVTPRSDPSQPVFLVENETRFQTSTRWPFWRLVNLVQRIWCWTWNMMFLLGILVPWCSPIGLRALCYSKPFMPDLELSQINGTLFPRKTSITQTMASRLIELWRHISKARTHFETEPDTGFIGKGFTRNMNRVWNYFVKGFLGTVVILFIFPIICLTASLSSIILAILAPLWVPAFTILLHVYMMLVYDLDCPDPSRNRYCVFLEALVWNIVIQGCFQPVAAVIVATFICPMASVIVLIVGVARYWLRLLWDSLTFHMFIKKCGRVPASDSLAVRRIAGPGLALDYYFIIKPEQALAAFESKMELDELQAYQHSMERVILQPQKDFSQFVEACFGPFSAQLSKTGPYRALDREAQDLMISLHEKLEKRRRDLQTGLTTAVKSRVKLNTMELKIAIQLAAHMLEKFYPSHVFGRLSLSEDEFWDNKGLSVGDWPGLAGLIYTEIFSLDFLTPLSDTDTHFKLEPHSQLDLTRYTEMVQNSTDVIGSNGPDLLGNVYAPRGNVQVHLPFLEVSAFNPRSRITMTFRKPEKRDTTTGLTTPRVRAHRTQQSNDSNKPWRPWKRKNTDRGVAEKLLIPLPIPHPVHIAISIHNRDSEQPIPLDSELCWEILRAIEDCHGDIQAITSVARYRGSGGAGDSSIDSIDSDSSAGTRESVTAAGGTETLPCGNREISINVNFDGLPIYKSSKDEFWPILFNIHENSSLRPMVIGIYYGKGKPSDLKAFITPFVNEAKRVLSNGIEIDGIKVAVRIRCFICDSPARAFIKGVANFNSQNGCLKCTTVGEYSYVTHCNIFPRIKCPKRTDEGFRSKIYDLHHKSYTPLEELPINMIDDFPIADSLHLIDLGIMKRCLMGWRDGSFRSFKMKWSARDTLNITTWLRNCKTPTEIHRSVRGLDCLSHWKGLEYRTFLYYLGIVILKDYLPYEVYEHFLVLFCAITICSSSLHVRYINVAEEMLDDYVEKYKEIYGEEYVTSNVHNISHLVDDVRKFGVLSTFSSYPFESKLFQIKNMLRNSTNPLVQVAKRITEQCLVENENVFINSNRNSPAYTLKNKHCGEGFDKTPLINATFFNTIQMDGFLLCTEKKNKWFLTNNNEIIGVESIIQQNEVISIYGSSLKSCTDFFETPVRSSYLKIFKSNCEKNEAKLYNLNTVKCKLVAVDYNDITTIFIPLLHTL